MATAKQDIKEYAYIIDYSTSSIYEVEIDEENENLETDELLDMYNLNGDECYIMFTQCKVEIKTLTRE